MSTEREKLGIARLLEIGRTLMTELDEEVVLLRVLEIAREATGAQYAALGIFDEGRTRLERFFTVGIDAHTRSEIGQMPLGRGVLGELIEHPRPLRLVEVSEHPKSFGFPPGHPQMQTFLGVPLMTRKRAWGSLYLAEKHGGQPFTEEDEQAAVALADWASVAIDNARLYEMSERRREELEKAVRGLQATRDVAIAIGSDLSLEHALALIAERGRALVGARSLVIMLREGPELVVSAGAGHVEDLRGMRLPVAGSTSGEVLEGGSPQRITDVSRMKIAPRREFGVPDPRTALLVPLIYRAESVGVLAAFDRGDQSHGFTEDDEQLLEIFAASAATAVAMAQSAQSDRLRSALAAADAERRRWGRELHDETLQGLGGMRVLLASALRRGNPTQIATAAQETVGHIEREIRNLRSIISELRPAALDELGLRDAIEALVEHQAEAHSLKIELDLHLRDRPEQGRVNDREQGRISDRLQGRGGGDHEGLGDQRQGRDSDHRLDPELEVGIYRLIQEALTNVVKHAKAKRVQLAVREQDEEVTVEVRDDGIGFAAEDGRGGFGLLGMRERVRLADGTLSISSSPQGTLVRARLSTVRRTAAAAPGETEQQAQAPGAPVS
ncbi:MAG TPA: GAF domain-containing sensor histidine kinase [Solirubrobacteraceae bacterium]|jgi:signal transduction histidine kinase